MSKLPSVVGNTTPATLGVPELPEPGAYGGWVAEQTFEAYLPVDCPPKDAITGPKELYRFCPSKNIAAEDFQTPFELGKFPDADSCQRCSLSVLPSLAAAMQLKAKVSFFKSQQLVRGVVPADAGRLKHTGSKRIPDHWSWWPALGIDRSTFFEVVP